MSGDSLKVIESPLMGFLSCTDIQEFYEVTLLDSQRWVESSKVADTVTPVNLWDLSSLQSTTVTSDTLPSLSTSIEVRVIRGLEVMWFVSVTMVTTKLSLCQHLNALLLQVCSSLCLIITGFQFIQSDCYWRSAGDNPCCPCCPLLCLCIDLVFVLVISQQIHQHFIVFSAVSTYDSEVSCNGVTAVIYWKFHALIMKNSLSG